MRAPYRESASQVGWIVLGFLCFWLAFVGLEPKPLIAGQSTEAFTPSEATKKIEDLEKRIKIAEQNESEQTALQMGLQLSDLNERIGKLKVIRSAYERLLTALKKKESLEEEDRLLREKLGGGQQLGMVQKPPYNLSFFDSVLDELDAAEQQKETVGLAVKLSKKGLEDATERLESALKEWRAASEQRDAKAPQERDLKLIWETEKALLEKELAEGVLRLETANHANLLKQAGISELRMDLTQRKVTWVRNHLYFDEADQKRQLDSLARSRTELEGRVQELIQGQEEARQAWLNAQNQAADATDGNLDPVREAFLTEREAWRETYQIVLEQTEERLRLLAHQEQVWKLRYALIAGGMPHEKAVAQGEEIEDQIGKIRRLLGVQQRYQSSLQSQIGSLEKKISEEALDTSVKSHLENRVKALQKRFERYFEFTSFLLATEQLDRRVLDEIDAGLRRVSLKQRLLGAGDRLQKVWDFELWAIDNYSVTVRKLLTATFILIMGVLSAKYLLRALSRRVFALAHLEEGTASVILKTVTYFAYLFILIFALRMVNIPLGAFAFLGGAIAIGFGFGAQNLINNFISGFILMGERPIHIGDLIELEGILGRVEEIGARCTRVRTGENIHILVPNSSFLEKNITNWTLSDRNIRAKVTAGVIYGSPVREVERLLIKAATEDERVLRKPEPFVIFNDFGDNALIFELYFWIAVRQTIERRLIESSVRFRIDELFREAGIVIAFPQRDVHLDASGPLEFRLVDAGPINPSSRPRGQ